MENLLKTLKGEIGHMIGFFTLVGMALAFVATKEDVNDVSAEMTKGIETVNTNVSMLRMELTIRVNENKLHSLDKMPNKSPEILREIAALEASNQRLEAKMEDNINAISF